MTTGAGRFRPKVDNLSTPDVADTLNLRQLYRLMEEYTQRLTELTSEFGTQRRNAQIGIQNDEVAAKDLIFDIEYLANRTMRLVNKASAYRETASISEIDQLELELYLFDAENSLRTAKKILDRFDIKIAA